MNTRTKLAVLAAATALIAPATAQAKDIDVSASLTGATDYVWRGVSQSNSDPAVFATVNVSAGGFYAGAGTENVDFAGIKQEYDLWAGYTLPLLLVSLFGERLVEVVFAAPSELWLALAAGLAALALIALAVTRRRR